MGSKKDKKKKAAKDPLKKAALAAKKDAKADKAALKRLQKEQDRRSSLSVDDGEGDHARSSKAASAPSATSAPDDLDALLKSYRNRTKEMDTAKLEDLEEPFPLPPRGNFTWTLCPSNGTLYMFGGEYYNGAENVVFDELLRWDPDSKRKFEKKNGDDDDDGNVAHDAKTGRWTRILTPPPAPPPRCAHSAVHHNNALFVFGGEMATAEKYHHYRDLWKFNIKSNTWEECKSKGGSPPAARSGHRAVVWRHYMILFGGFHEALRPEARWFNDVHIYDFQSSSWAELKYGKLARAPPPRSACSMALCTHPTETLFVYGGYSKIRNANAPGASKSEGITHTDCWVLPLKQLVGADRGGCVLKGGSPPSWERIARKGEYPSVRAGASCALHKNKMLVFGGVLDHERDHHKMESVFYNDLFSLDMERRRWFAIRLKKSRVGGGRRLRRKKDYKGSALGVDFGGAKDGAGNVDDDESDADVDDNDEDVSVARNEEAVSNGWNLDQLRHDMFAFICGHGDVVFDKIKADEGSVCTDHSKDMVKEGGAEVTPLASKENTDLTGTSNNIEIITVKSEQSTVEAEQSNQTNLREVTSSLLASKPIKDLGPSSEMKVGGGLPMAVARRTPLPRINSAAVVRNNTLFIYGGVLEVGDREVTLDDCWSIDLNKRDKWTCIWAGQMHRQVWKGVYSDNESYISSDHGGSGDGDSDIDVAEFETIIKGESGKDSEEARKKTKNTRKKEKPRNIRHGTMELNEKLGVDDELRTPLMGEAVADFYARTSEYWNMEASNSIGKATADRGEALSTKELKREGFGFAKKRYEELRPILDRLNEPQYVQMESKEKKAKKKADKKKPKKDRSR